MSFEASAKLRGRKSHLASFTLIELLTVIAIIVILASLVLYAASGVMSKAARSRATTEIQAYGTALEAYKNDNGIYPPTGNNALPLTTTNGTTTYASTDGSVSGGAYQQSAQTLYSALSGKTNYLDTPVAGITSYFNFKINEVGNSSTAAGTGPGATTSTYVRDPWNYSYGYSTGDIVGTTTNAPYNGYGFYDLWTTGGKIGNGGSVATNTWIANFPL